MRSLIKWLLCLVALAAVAETPATPDRFTVKGAPGPFWISVSQATAGGIASSEPCGVFILTTHQTSVGPLESWDEVAQSAGAIYLGTVTAVTAGFQGRVPASILRVEDLEVFATAPGFPREGPVYVLYPAADFNVNGKRLCNAGPDASYRPMAGDQVLIVAHDPPPDGEGRFLPTELEQLVFARGERVVVPARLRNDESRQVRTLNLLAASLAKGTSLTR